MPVSERQAAVLARAERDERAARMAATGSTYDQIAAACGFKSKQAAHAAVKRVLEDRRKRLALAGDALIAREEEVIGAALAKAREIMEAEHLAHGNGRIVRREIERPDGSVELVDVIDSGPNLAAAAALVRFSESRRKLLGLDAPSKTNATVESTINYVINASAEELEQL